MKLSAISTIIVSLLFIGSAFVSAQSAADLSLAGVTMPRGNDMYSNPALAHANFRTGSWSVPLPLGVLNLVSTDDFDALYVLDAALHPESYLFNPANGNLDGVFQADVDDEGEAQLEFDFDADLGDLGGLFQSVSRGVTGSVDLPISFRLGGQVFALRPFVNTYAQIRLGAELGETTTVALERVRLKAQAGFSADWLSANELAAPLQGKRYMGFRLAPFYGLANIDADIKEADLIVDGRAPDASFRIDAASFVSFLSGAGLMMDIGMMDALPVSEANADQLLFGVSVRNLGFSYWGGRRNDLVGEGSLAEFGETELEFIGEDAGRFFFAPNLSLLFHGAYTRQINETFELTVAGDASIDLFSESLSTSLGTEALLDTAFSRELALRAGIGYQRGFKWGVGAGASWGWFGLDTALHSFRSTASNRSTYGLAVSSRFNF